MTDLTNDKAQAVKIEPGRKRGPNDGSRRFLPVNMTFDTRSHCLTVPLEEDCAPLIRAQWEENQAKIRESLIHDFGANNYRHKVQNFIDLGNAPWSIIALHSIYLEQIRDAFVAQCYYPALLGACGLGERILNQLVLTLRDEDKYKNCPATKYVKSKESINKWDKCIDALREWGIFDDETVRGYRALMKMRNTAIHYQSELDSGEARETALTAIQQISSLIERIFQPIGESPYYFRGPKGRYYVRLESESNPFVKHFILPSCVLVSPVYRFIRNTSGFDVHDDPEYGINRPPLTDEQFADPSRAMESRNSP
ncbi:Protein of unknown function DUF86 [Propionibacterium ruminifibrarum]|uniref:DUF4145 domain-containing protein n=1 Tax=Propionibacterium ruminifibrarum TaxID=1962131 RepID=A0A375I6C4_9ACTN|nr:hypothetical protein [Propionibacterium ruminifibrarum]SPF69403.1 Protein of unknown function DUF86 [Propionibacterium ruminifibrarum]